MHHDSLLVDRPASLDGPGQSDQSGVRPDEGGRRPRALPEPAAPPAGGRAPVPDLLGEQVTGSARARHGAQVAPGEPGDEQRRLRGSQHGPPGRQDPAAAASRTRALADALDPDTGPGEQVLRVALAAAGIGGAA